MSLLRRLEAYRSRLRRLLSSPRADSRDRIHAGPADPVAGKLHKYLPSESATVSIQSIKRGYNQISNLLPWLVKVAVIIALILLGQGLLAGLLLSRIEGAK